MKHSWTTLSRLLHQKIRIKKFLFITSVVAMVWCWSWFFYLIGNDGFGLPGEWVAGFIGCGSGAVFTWAYFMVKK